MSAAREGSRMVDRRDFVARLVTTAVASVSPGLLGNIVTSDRTRENLVPESPANAPNYWCTWAAQNYMYGHKLARLDPKILEGGSGSGLAHDAMNEDVLFGENGW